MSIEKLSECQNASKYGTCSECGVSESETHNLYRLRFNGEIDAHVKNVITKARKRRQR